MKFHLQRTGDFWMRDKGLGHINASVTFYFFKMGER